MGLFLFFKIIIEAMKKYIERVDYFRKMKKFLDKPVIKVVTGMRRVGKSYFFESD